MSQNEEPIEPQADADRSDKFTISPVGLVVTQCVLCEHMGKGRFWYCRAFPGKIPDEIRQNKVDHSLPYEGDDGIRFSPRPDVLPELLAALRGHFSRSQ